MTEMLIIADDLTGAIDAAAPFIGAGVEVCCDYGEDASEVLTGSARVVSVNANTRHLDAATARERVCALAAAGVTAGVHIVFKKTDSVLRGNVGSELEGALVACGTDVAHFLPSFPKIDRVTVDGIHLIGGVPVAECPIADDPFEPVRQSRVAEIIGAKSDVATTEVHVGKELQSGFSGIAIYDAQTDEELFGRAHAILADGDAPVLVAGCAGIAGALARALEIPPAPMAPENPQGSTLVFCGSVNLVSVGQVAFAREHGAPVHVVSPVHILDSSWSASPDFGMLARDVAAELTSAPFTVVDASTRSTPADIAAAGIKPGCDLRSLVSSNLGRAAAMLAMATDAQNVFVMGGDVLLEMLESLRVKRCGLIAQVAPGVVVFEVAVIGRAVRIVSKSGGFGEPDMFQVVADRLSDIPGLPR